MTTKTKADKAKMTTIASLRRERDVWRKRALAAEEGQRKAQVRNGVLIDFFDTCVMQQARVLNVARNK